MTLNDFLKIEKELGLDQILIEGDIPLWRICRRQVRLHYLKIVTKTALPQLRFCAIVRNVTISFFQILTQLLKRKQKDYIFYSHARLYKIKGEYFDKLTDPIIDLDNIINKSYCILQYPQNGEQKRPRVHSKNTINLDFVVAFSKFYSIFNRRRVYKRYKFYVEALLQRLASLDGFKYEVYKTIILDSLLNFLFSYKINSCLLRSFSPKHIFVAPRNTHSAAVVYCRRNNIVISELEHGITLTENVLYSGVYNSIYDVDYFLTFGEASDNSCFGMPESKIINIGYAYKDWLESKANVDIIYDKHCVLIISDPHITDAILNITKELATQYPNYKYYFRCHPQEMLFERHLSIINTLSNIYIYDNKEESFQALMKFQIIIGENSSALFEAISLGKRVGRLNFNGLEARNSNPNIYGGEIINRIDAFEEFLITDIPSLDSIKTAYSRFTPEIIHKITSI